MGLKENEHCILLLFPLDVIILILKYCNLRSLGRLACTCKKLNTIVNEDVVWLNEMRKTLFYNRKCRINHDRFCRELTFRQGCLLDFNWLRNIYCIENILHCRIRYMPWLQLTKDKLYISFGNSIKCADHAQHLTSIWSFNREFCNHHEDVSKFAVKEDVIVSASHDKSVCCWDLSSGKLNYKLCGWQRKEINCVDFLDHGRLLVTGSRNGVMKVGLINDDFNVDVQKKLNVSDRIISLSTHGGSVFLGTSGFCRSSSPLLKVDLARCQATSTLGTYKRYGAGILDIYPDSPHLLLTCGYDSAVRLWDTRMNKCVIEWEDPYDYAVYCVVSDQNNAILSGTSRHGLVRLWDKRKNRCVQMYFAGKTSSPVYSVNFDPYHMFIALDTGLHSISFYGNNLTRHNTFI